MSHQKEASLLETFTPLFVPFPSYTDKARLSRELASPPPTDQ